MLSQRLRSTSAAPAAAHRRAVPPRLRTCCKHGQARVLALLLLIAAAAGGFLRFRRPPFPQAENLQDLLARVHSHYRSEPLQTGLVFFAAYVAVTGLSLPGAAVMTLLAGAIFGLLWGTVIVSFASTAGATLAFPRFRFVLRDWVQARFGERLKAINEGVAKEGPFYLFALRLVPVFPFVAINLLMGLTPIRAWTYFWVSQVGMLAGTIVYVYAGTKLGEFRISSGLLAAFVLLGLFPLAAKRAWTRSRRAASTRAGRKPASFDRNLVVIGAGSAGLVSAYIAAAVKAKVTLVEKHRMGGDCLNTGCVPSKALLRQRKSVHQAEARKYGIKTRRRIRFRRRHGARAARDPTIEPHDSVERYHGLGVECLQGEAKIVSPWAVEITADGRKQTPDHALHRHRRRRAAVRAADPRHRAHGCLTSDTIWDLRKLPARLVVLGGGPIGSELAQAFARLGSKVTQVEMLPRILARDDPEIADMVMKRFAAEGVDVRVGHKAKEFRLEEGRKLLVCEHQGQEVRIEFDEVLCAVGRVANTAGYGLEELGIPTTKARTVETDEYLQTLYPNIYACGDVAGPFQFTHTACTQAWYASVNALLGGVKKFRADYSVIPWATFTDPGGGARSAPSLPRPEAKERHSATKSPSTASDDLDRRDRRRGRAPAW
jgi:pyruvate/2-oxoglutarate dehydrogenase complex dihydrolipoamide dehydrogenase (E3) component/uncharacterized membrane protein YdjX (TVP38/TMEM64 family)